MDILKMDQVNTFYGVSHILFDISMNVSKGSITGVLGRNGAGKTTTLRTIMGIAPASTGTIIFRGEEIRNMKPHVIAKKGIAYVPDDRQIFAPLTVYENLIIGVSTYRGGKGRRWTIDRMYELFPVLKRSATRKGTHISGGEQKMLAIGRALMCNPELVLLDEPTEGLAPLIVVSLAETIQKIGHEEVTIVLADQNINFARRIIHFGYIIDKGKIEFGAPMEDIWCDKALVRKYLAV